MGETNLEVLLKTMTPKLNEGEYVFGTVQDINHYNPSDMLMIFREAEGWTVVLRKTMAEQLGIPFTYTARWLTLSVHSSLEAVGLTAAFSNALAKDHISCNVVAGYYHDHIFVAPEDAERAMAVLVSARGMN